jgi:hypothetical protein
MVPCMLTELSQNPGTFHTIYTVWVLWEAGLLVVKKKLSLCLINQAPCHEDIWRSGDTAPPFLTSALDGGEWPVSCPSHFTPRTNWTGGWVGPRASLNALKKRKVLPRQESNPDHPAHSLHYTNWAILTPYSGKVRTKLKCHTTLIQTPRFHIFSKLVK